MLCVRRLGPLTDSPGQGIVCPPSVPAQLEVINTGNLIQRQETPLPPTEFKLNALLFFLAKSRFAGLSLLSLMWPGQVDVSGGYASSFHQSDRPSQFQSDCWFCFIAGPFIPHYSKSLSYSIFPLHQQDLSILSGLEYLWKVYFICFFLFFFYCYSCANRPP